MDNDETKAILGASSKCSTLVDGTLRVQIDVAPAHAQTAFALFGSPGSPVALARLKNDAALTHDRKEAAKEVKPTKGPHGDTARMLVASGFFRCPEVWEAVGTDDEYLAWVKLQPSALDGNYSEYHDSGDKYCVPAHVRRVEYGSGTGIKPPYSAIPLTHNQHTLAHKDGDSAVGSETWWKMMRIKYVEQWAREALKATLGESSWTDISSEVIVEWASHHGLARYLPAGITFEHATTQSEGSSEEGQQS